MPRANSAKRKRRSQKYKARKTALKRKQETPEQRAARLESMREYTRRRRAKESETQRQERLKSMRWYSRTRREKEKAFMRRERVAEVIERCKYSQDSDALQEMVPIDFVSVEME